eukprot:PhF_6_TR42824/c0_g1_i5/m.64837
MGCKTTKPAERESPMTGQFNSDLFPFLDGKTNAEFNREAQAVAPFPSHNDAIRWAEDQLKRIQQALAERGYQGTFTYDLVAFEAKGEITYKIGFRKPVGAVGPDQRSMVYILRYVVPESSLPPPNNNANVGVANELHPPPPHYVTPTVNHANGQ